MEINDRSVSSSAAIAGASTLNFQHEVQDGEHIRETSIAVHTVYKKKLQVMHYPGG